MSAFTITTYSFSARVSSFSMDFDTTLPAVSSKKTGFPVDPAKKTKRASCRNDFFYVVWDDVVSRRSAGAAERDGLENRCGGNSTQGSNPCSSAIFFLVFFSRAHPIV